MKYDVCVVGHGKYPDGIYSAMKLLVGCNDDITCFNLDESTTHDQFRIDVANYLKQHENVIVFADMTGGAPYQITAEEVLTLKKENQYILSSVSMNVILDVYLKNSMEQLNPENIVESLEHVIEESNHLTMITPNDMQVEDEIEEGGI